MDKNIIRDLQGMTIATPESLTDLKDVATWGIATATDLGDNILVERNGAGGGWGVVTNKRAFIQANVEYVLEFEYKTSSVERFSYNYFVSSDGNAVIGRLDAIPDNQWHAARLQLSSLKDRRECGVLIGSDFRNSQGESFFIRNVHLYPASNPPLVFEEVKEIRVMQGNQWKKSVDRLLKQDRWVEYLRPPIEWEERAVHYDDQVSIDVWQINDNMIRFDQIHNSATNFDKSKFKDRGEITFTCTARFSGIFFRFLDIQPNTTYNLSYDYEVIGGDLVSFGGHTDATYSNNVCYLNGKRSSTTYGGEFSVYDKNTIHQKNNVRVVLTTPDSVVDINRLFIQPNRYNAVEVSVRVSNVKFEVGERATSWNYKEG